MDVTGKVRFPEARRFKVGRTEELTELFFYFLHDMLSFGSGKSVE